MFTGDGKITIQITAKKVYTWLCLLVKSIVVKIGKILLILLGANHGTSLFHLRRYHNYELQLRIMNCQPVMSAQKSQAFKTAQERYTKPPKASF